MHWMKKIRHGSKKHEGALQNIVEDREVMALVYLCDDLTIRAGSGGRQHKSGHRAQWTDGGDPGCDDG